MADDDHLLVVAAERKHPLVQQHLTARPVDGEGEHPVRTHLRAHHAGVGVPEQPTHPRPTTRRPGQRLDDRRPAVGEELIGIRPPPHELDRVTVARRGQHSRQGVVVHTSVHQRADRVALGPRPEAGRPIAALELREEPVPDRALPGLPDPESRSHQRQELLAVRCPDHCRTDGTPARRGQIDLRAIDVEHLPQPDHRNTVRAAVREIDEHLRVVPPIIPEEHPPHVRHPVREMFDPGKLARPAAPDDPSRREAAARRQQRARRITVTFEQARDRPSQHASERRSGRTPARRPDQPKGRGPDGAWPASNDDLEDWSCAGPEAAPADDAATPTGAHHPHRRSRHGHRRSTSSNSSREPGEPMTCGRDVLLASRKGRSIFRDGFTGRPAGRLRGETFSD